VAKFLLVIAVFIVLYLMLRNHAAKSEAAQSPHSASKHGEDMVRCGVCGVHLPTSEAITSRGAFFCSKEHLRLSGRDHGSG
jgi:uncharacterized protein